MEPLMAFSQYLEDWRDHIGPSSDYVCMYVVGLRVFTHHGHPKLRQNLNNSPSATPICDKIGWVRWD